MSFIEDIKWRGMLHDIMPGTEELLVKNKVTGYIGFDPTAASLHVGSLVQIMLLVHLQNAGHKPIALIGGATGMIGDPSGKKQERKLLTVEEIRHNEQCIKKQLEKFLNFNCGKNSAEIVNNNDWFQNINIISFLRDVGKFLTVNYLIGKGFIKDRLNIDDISFTEFNYILMQAYDFLWLLENKNCVLQLGGSDQWGNITAGSELIRKKLRKETFALTCPLLTKSDGTKFGKTEEGNIWLDPQMTSPYKFYQFWINTSDADAGRYIRIFTLLDKDEILDIENKHSQSPHLRTLQKALAKDLTIRVHSIEQYNDAIDASEILFGKTPTAKLKEIKESTLLSVFEGVPQVAISRQQWEEAQNVTDFLSATTQSMIFSSKSEARRMIQSGGVSINKVKITTPEQKMDFELLQNKYLLAQKGKKDYFLVKVV